MRHISICLLGVVLALWATAEAMAEAITDVVKITVSGKPDMILSQPNGDPAMGQLREDSEKGPLGDTTTPILFTVGAGTIEAGAPASASVALTEPANQGAGEGIVGTISDLATVTVGNVPGFPDLKLLTFTLRSDVNEATGIPLAAVPAGTRMVAETGSDQSITIDLLSNVASISDFDVFVNSDVTIPEPTSLVMLSTGVLGVLVAACCRRKHAAA